MINKEKIGLIFFAENKLPDYNPYDMNDVKLLMNGYRGFNVESIKRFIKRGLKDPSYLSNLRWYYYIVKHNI